jgi:MtN3 and saliva related transmembrane protein
MNTTQWIGIAAGVLTSVSMLPQLIKIIKERKAHDVSIVMLLVLMAGLAMWATYGFMREDWPIIVTNGFSFLLNSVVLFFRIKFSGVK